MGSKIENYTVVSEHDLDTLIHKVNELVKRGYEPLDGARFATPVLNSSEVAPLFLQTMVQRT